MMKSGTFSKRSGAATKRFELCGFGFQMASFNENAVLYVLGWYICLERRLSHKTSRMLP